MDMKEHLVSMAHYNKWAFEKLISKVHRVAYFSESMNGHTFDQETINQFTKSIQSKIK